MAIPISKPYIGEEEKWAVLEVLDSGMLVQGTRTAKLEEKFAAVCGTQYAIATSSGTTALHVALLAHGIGPGDEVITTPFTFIATAEVIVLLGAVPVFVDIEPETGNIDAQAIKAAITPRTRAIMPVALYGQPADMAAINAIAARHRLPVIEDAAQSFGGELTGKRAGSLADIGCTSFFPATPLARYADIPGLCLPAKYRPCIWRKHHEPSTCIVPADRWAGACVDHSGLWCGTEHPTQTVRRRNCEDHEGTAGAVASAARPYAAFGFLPGAGAGTYPDTRHCHASIVLVPS